MPHKRAKLSVRRENANQVDIAPTGDLNLSQESLPKNLLRVLQADQIRKNYREKRTREKGKDVSDEGGDIKRHKKEDGSKSLVIKHGESLKQFNRRVEDGMRAQVSEAMQASRSITKKVNKEEKKAKEDRIAVAQGKVQPKETEDSHTAVVTQPKAMDFAKAEQRRRLNDIVQEPPTFTKLPRGAKSTKVETLAKGVVSMAQKHMMELEREQAVKRYRELKEKRLAQKET